jgi:hypothetical protein
MKANEHKLVYLQSKNLDNHLCRSDYGTKMRNQREREVRGVEWHWICVNLIECVKFTCDPMPFIAYDKWWLQLTSSTTYLTNLTEFLTNF